MKVKKKDTGKCSEGKEGVEKDEREKVKKKTGNEKKKGITKGKNGRKRFRENKSIRKKKTL